VVVYHLAAMHETAEPGSGALEDVGVGCLALLVGQRLNELVVLSLHAAGFAELRESHGYVFQHLAAGPKNVGELAERLGVSQQAASKSVAELVEVGYLDEVTVKDRRSRRVCLSPRGRAAMAKARAIRAEQEECFLEKFGPGPLAALHRTLHEMLTDLGGINAVRGRRVGAPR
jgi:DNA-binding MarR family transcriptional regulator